MWRHCHFLQDETINGHQNDIGFILHVKGRGPPWSIPVANLGYSLLVFACWEMATLLEGIVLYGKRFYNILSYITPLRAECNLEGLPYLLVLNLKRHQKSKLKLYNIGITHHVNTPT